MAIDTSIYGMIQPAQAQDPLAQYGKAISLQNMIGQNDLHQLQTGKLRKDIATEEAVSAAVKAGTDPGKAFQQAGDWKGLSAWEKAQTDKQKAQADFQKTTIESNGLAVKAVADEWAKLKDGDSTAPVAEMARKVFKAEDAAKAIAGLPPVATADLITKATMNAERLTKNMADALTRATTERGQNMTAQTGANALAETVRSHGVNETNAAGQLAVSRQNAGTAAGNLAETRAEHGRVAARAGQHFDSERGIIVNTAAGTSRSVTADGVPIGPKDKELNDAQAKALLYSSRMMEAEKVIDGLSKGGKNFSTPGSRTGFGVGDAVNVVNSSQGQQLDQAKRNFINAVLRRESGAVIAQSEFDNGEKQYFPQVGDSADVIAQKAANRKTAIDGIAAEVPKAKRPAAAPTPATKKPQGIDATKLSDAELKRELGL